MLLTLIPVHVDEVGKTDAAHPFSTEQFWTKGLSLCVPTSQPRPPPVVVLASLNHFVLVSSASCSCFVASFKKN